MADEVRLKGQETEVLVSRGRQLVQSLSFIQSSSIQYDLESNKQGYLGQRTVQVDDVFMGVSGSFVAHAKGQEILTFVDYLKLRAQRRASGTQEELRVNLTARFSFPNGQTPKLLVPNLAFGNIPINIAGREQYVTISFSFISGDARVLAL